MSRFAWCETHQHSMCRGSYQRIYVNDKNKVVREDEVRTCACECHREAE